MTEYSTLAVHRHDAVGEVRFTRPELHNRFDELLFGELGPAFAELEGDDGVNAVVLTSTGKHFSAGGDTERMLQINADLRLLLKDVDTGRRLFRQFADFTKPIVSAVHGHVFGVATSLVLTTDRIVSTPGVRFSDPHVQLGLVAGDGGAVMWPSHLGLARAKRHLLWGEWLLAEDAWKLGMVSDLVETPEEVGPLAFELARQVAALPPVAVQLTKRTLNKALASRIDQCFDTGFYLEAITTQSEDLREAVAALSEKRPGVWQGR
ncbi:enoyl-CoA hydratase [Pseudofrankia sp. BMG5.36]|nr:enoyl-CoA hydratase [Pseudofrankia sp. BMG5.36]